MKSKLKLIIGVLSLLLFVFASAVFADSMDKMQIIKISPKDKQAIVKMNDGRLKIIKVGEEIPIK